MLLLVPGSQLLPLQHPEHDVSSHPEPELLDDALLDVVLPVLELLLDVEPPQAPHRVPASPAHCPSQTLSQQKPSLAQTHCCTDETLQPAPV
jgi:hypothetical protein